MPRKGRQRVCVRGRRQTSRHAQTPHQGSYEFRGDRGPEFLDSGRIFARASLPTRRSSRSGGAKSPDRRGSSRDEDLSCRCHVRRPVDACHQALRPASLPASSHARGPIQGRGQRAPEEPAYYAKIAEAAALGGGIVLVGHGAGKSNAAHHLTEYLHSHHRETYQRIVREIVADLSSITTAQLLDLARQALRS